MKRKILCKAYGCEQRRVHHESDLPRGPQWVEVPDTYLGDTAYCSFECLMYGQPKEQRMKKNKGFWTGIDLDRTLAYYDKYQGAGDIGAPIQPMVDLVKFMLEKGDDVRIFTARVYLPPEPNMRELEDYMAAHVAIENWCMEQFNQRLPITCSKDSRCTAIYDDIAHRVEANTGRILEPPL